MSRGYRELAAKGDTRVSFRDVEADCPKGAACRTFGKFWATIHGVRLCASDRLLVSVLVLALTVAPAGGQDPVRIDGTVLWISGQTLTLRSDIPSAPGYQITGQYVVPVPGPLLNVNVDLHQLPQTDYAHMRPGERVSVIGVMSSDGRRLHATSIIRGGEQAP
jgi:hypothetical protein